MRLFTPNVVTNGFILKRQRSFEAVAGDSEECSLGTAIHYQKIRGGGVCDAFELGKKKKNQAPEKAACPVSSYLFFFFNPAKFTFLKG